MNEYHILNLGAGVQSTTLYLMSMEGAVQKFDYAIFADTQEEPGPVYEHLQWMQSLNGPPILVRTKAKLGDDLMHGRNSAGGSFTSIPAYTSLHDGSPRGRTRRQCSNEYKVVVIERAIRRDVLGLKPRQRIPKGVTVHQYFGISLDEKSRATRLWERYHIDHAMIGVPHFPLIDKQFSRANCLDWLAGRVPHQVPRSACTFCPFHNDAEWQHLKDGGGADWDRIVQIDRALRTPGVIVNRTLEEKLYLHTACKPIDEIDFKPRVNRKEMQLGFGVECEGVCGV